MIKHDGTFKLGMQDLKGTDPLKEVMAPSPVADE